MTVGQLDRLHLAGFVKDESGEWVDTLAANEEGT